MLFKENFSSLVRRNPELAIKIFLECDIDELEFPAHSWICQNLFPALDTLEYQAQLSPMQINSGKNELKWL